jgi:hypothetical protein
MPIRAAWLRKRLSFRVCPGRSGSARSRSNTWVGLPYPVKLTRNARLMRLSADPQLTLSRQALSSMTDRHRARGCQGTASRLILVRSAYACSAIYQQFFVP